LASEKNPVITPDGLMLTGTVPWPAPVPAPKTSNVVMAPSGARSGAGRAEFGLSETLRSFAVFR
jgi:hypothetical protein